MATAARSSNSARGAACAQVSRKSFSAPCALVKGILITVDPFPDLDGAPAGDWNAAYTLVLRSALAQPRQRLGDRIAGKGERPLLVQRDVGTHDRGQPGRTVALVQRLPQRDA